MSPMRNKLLRLIFERGKTRERRASLPTSPDHRDEAAFQDDVGAAWSDTQEFAPGYARVALGLEIAVAGIGGLGDRSRMAVLLDDQVALFRLDDQLDLRVLVPRYDEEPDTFGADVLVLAP